MATQTVPETINFKQTVEEPAYVKEAPPNPVTELLIAGRSLIADPSHWCKSAWSREVVQREPRRFLRSRTIKSTAYCALGALREVSGCPLDGYSLTYITGHTTYDGAKILLDRSSFELYGDSIIAINDGIGTHSNIMRVYDRAIELSRGLAL